jgi:hypothetical protein
MGRSVSFYISGDKQTVDGGEPVAIASRVGSAELTATFDTFRGTKV